MSSFHRLRLGAQERVHGTGVSSGPLYQALVVVLAGVIIYAFLKAQRERAGQVAAPADNPPLEPSAGR